ncbi:siderophore-iron reductase FhuF [Bacillus mesophilus]|uniref:Siderophore-iron reductase FhuF n=1 Tax=Bacillus mesophilus TaxID=1808955 RepID=A0A6M0Q746_9BACI|nr:siderophore-iron reductase FhuF [Bacillus mesophilus]MBM7661484.1 siderophore-iron reductase FhuF [Bacillus mesophilus]NEY72155.1 siderophore-iron reductase FhuF [Bacillus mesophilus]
MVSKQLQSNELELLRNYRLTVKDVPEGFSFPCSKLLDEKFVGEFLIELQEMYQIDEPYVAASQFMKRYGYNIMVPFLYSMSMFDKRLDFSLTSSVFQSYEDNGTWLPKLQLGNLDVTTVEDHRDSWRTASFKSIFRDHLSPVIEVLSVNAKVSRHNLWENAAVYIFWIYESMMEKEPNHPNLKEDFQALLEAEGTVFGSYSKNPIRKFYTEKKYISHKDSMLRVRKTCCFYNRLPDSEDGCSTCPQTCNVKIKEEMR